MKVIIAGSRHFTHLSNEYIGSIVYKSDFLCAEVVCGCADGVDTAGESWADHNLIQVTYFKPDWELYGNRGGPIRNSKMAAYADALILIWDGTSKGSQDMKSKMEKLNKPVYEVILKV